MKEKKLTYLPSSISKLARESIHELRHKQNNFREDN